MILPVVVLGNIGWGCARIRCYKDVCTWDGERNKRMEKMA